MQEVKWRELLTQRFGPLLASYGAAHELDVITDYGSDPLEGIASAVCQMADRLDADALVLASHGKSSLMEWLLGSVTAYCARHCNRPVVVLHGSELTGW